MKQQRFIKAGISSAIVGFFIFTFLSVACGFSYFPGISKGPSFCSIIWSGDFFSFLIKVIPVMIIFFLIPFMGNKDGRSTLVTYINKFTGDTNK
jgi:hypothetical protein